MKPHRRTASVWLLWLIVGTLASLCLQWRAASVSDGNWTILIGVGRDSGLRAPIERQVDNLAFTFPQGHDGQFSFLIATDPFNRHDTQSVLSGEARYRYRRILYPFLASVGGLLHGSEVLTGLVVLAALGIGLATAAVASLSVRLGLSRWVVLCVLANPGVWLTLLLLTPDALALGLALSGLLLWWDHHWTWAAIVLALAALTKEQYLLVALSVGGWTWFNCSHKSGVALALGATIPLAVWSVWLSLTIDHGTILGNGILPLGILRALPLWSPALLRELVLTGLTLLGVALATIIPIVGGTLFRWLAWPWVGLALIVSPAVWSLGSNAARVFVPLWVFSAISLAAVVKSHRTLVPIPAPPFNQADSAEHIS